MSKEGTAPVEIRIHEEEPPIAGRVHIMTDEPLELDAHGRSALRWVTALLSRRPWIAPALILGAGVAFLLLRRR